jgi:amidohydrolase
LRRDFHRHPELSFQETRTAAVVADTLHEIGQLAVQTGVGRTGVVADLGQRPGPTIAIRADMDALPIPEATGLEYASENPGVMHACGTMLTRLGFGAVIAQDLMDARNRPAGCALFFNPRRKMWTLPESAALPA